ncbi:MAG: HAD-IIIA family hydrolase [Dissulfurispiraceae bacterium]|jgi:3-deoxy-D-manno-octulosonate 8-phosphate phosphatase (KDO 8-P phosphatase)|nr:HAD-IIIA family hydrolase [Dissulfurispiraceae bacterium]
MRRIVKKLSAKELSARAAKIKILILDVDGVMTDGGIIFDNNANELKVFNVKDGHGIKMLHKAGIGVAIITGRKSKVVAQRAKELGIKDVYQGFKVKTDALEKILNKYGLRKYEAAFVGDDVIDIPVFFNVGLAVAVSDAVAEAKAAAHHITKCSGGKGAVREVCELILRSSGKWKALLDVYYKV